MKSPEDTRKIGLHPKPSKPEKKGPKPWHVQKDGPNKGKLYVPLNDQGGGVWLFPDDAHEQLAAGDIPAPPDEVGGREGVGREGFPDQKTEDEEKYPYLHKGD